MPRNRRHQMPRHHRRNNRPATQPRRHPKPTRANRPRTFRNARYNRFRAATSVDRVSRAISATDSCCTYRNSSTSRSRAGNREIASSSSTPISKDAPRPAVASNAFILMRPASFSCRRRRPSIRRIPARQLRHPMQPPHHRHPLPNPPRPLRQQKKHRLRHILRQMRIPHLPARLPIHRPHMPPHQLRKRLLIPLPRESPQQHMIVHRHRNCHLRVHRP